MVVLATSTRELNGVERFRHPFRITSSVCTPEELKELNASRAFGQLFSLSDRYRPCIGETADLTVYISPTRIFKISPQNGRTRILKRRKEHDLDVSRYIPVYAP